MSCEAIAVFNSMLLFLALYEMNSERTSDEKQRNRVAYGICFILVAAWHIILVTNLIRG